MYSSGHYPLVENDAQQIWEPEGKGSVGGWTAASIVVLSLQGSSLDSAALANPLAAVSPNERGDRMMAISWDRAVEKQTCFDLQHVRQPFHPLVLGAQARGPLKA